MSVQWENASSKFRFNVLIFCTQVVIIIYPNKTGCMSVLEWSRPAPCQQTSLVAYIMYNTYILYYMYVLIVYVYACEFVMKWHASWDTPDPTESLSAQPLPPVPPLVLSALFVHSFGDWCCKKNTVDQTCIYIYIYMDFFPHNHM